MDTCDHFILQFDFKQYKNEIRRDLIRRSLKHDSAQGGNKYLTQQYGVILDRYSSNPNISEHECSSYGDQDFITNEINEDTSRSPQNDEICSQEPVKEIVVKVCMIC